jgi:3-oxoadipate enol-lactonase
MRLAYTDEGPGPAVVLLHGFGLSRAMWDEQVAALGNIYRLIVPDLRGHGKSPAPEGIPTIDEMADDVVELLDHLAIREPVVVGGLSMGGYVALSVVSRYPERVRGLMLLDTRAAGDTAEAATTRRKLAALTMEAESLTPIVESFIPRLFGKHTMQHHADRVEAMRAVMVANSARGLAGVLEGMAVRPDRRADLANIQVPTLVVVGEEDLLTPPEEVKVMAEAIPGARMEVIAKAGHLAPYENPMVANAVILRFLEGLSAEAGSNAPA